MTSMQDIRRYEEDQRIIEQLQRERDAARAELAETLEDRREIGDSLIRACEKLAERDVTIAQWHRWAHEMVSWIEAAARAGKCLTGGWMTPSSLPYIKDALAEQPSRSVMCTCGEPFYSVGHARKPGNHYAANLGEE